MCQRHLNLMIVTGNVLQFHFISPGSQSCSCLQPSSKTSTLEFLGSFISLLRRDGKKEWCLNPWILLCLRKFVNMEEKLCLKSGVEISIPSFSVSDYQNNKDMAVALLRSLPSTLPAILKLSMALQQNIIVPLKFDFILLPLLFSLYYFPRDSLLILPLP